MQTVSSKMFYWTGNQASQEISSLGNFRFERVYPDACDIGFRMVSERTGKEAVFVVDHEDTDGEGDIQGWNLVPTRESVRRNPDCAGVRVLIIND